MNDVSFHVPYIFGNKQNSTEREKRERKQIQKEGTTEDREVWYQERPTVGPDRRERGKANSW